MNGCVLLVDKPYGWTSFDVVGKLKSLLRRQLGLKKVKIGHAGTLDPLATGLLIICTGKMTKAIDAFQAQEKEYTGTFFVGKTTASYDLETIPDNDYPTKHITEPLACAAARNLTGTIDQVPPLFSAKKIEGERAYEFARRGEKMEMPARQVVVKSFEITRFTPPDIDFFVVCSKGTYIRSLARDFGLALHSGAYLKSLRRTRIGNHKVEMAWTMELLEKHIRSMKTTAT